MRGSHIAVQTKSVHRGKLATCKACNSIQCKGCGSPFTLSTALDDEKNFCGIRCEDPVMFKQMQRGGVGRTA